VRMFVQFVESIQPDFSGCVGLIVEDSRSVSSPSHTKTFDAL
jgi:hypothetical protein